MKKNKDKLLISAIIMIIYTVFSFLYLVRKGEFITGDKVKLIGNILQLVITFIGCTYFIVLYNSKIDLKKHKNFILFFSIIFFIIDIISGVLGYIVYKDLSDYKKRDLPVLEDVKGYNKYIYLIALAVCLIILFVISNYVKTLIGSILIYVSILFIMTFVYRKRLVRDFKKFKEYFREYNSLVLKTWGLSLLTLIFLSLIITFITNLDNATNQESLNEMFKKVPFLVAFLTMIYAPISEELMFRGVFKEFIKNKWAFILISGFVFGAVHVIDDFQSYSELLFILVYSSLGCYLAYLYQKTNNIFSNIYFHFLQNTLSILIMFLTK